MFLPLASKVCFGAESRLDNSRTGLQELPRWLNVDGGKGGRKTGNNVTAGMIDWVQQQLYCQAFRVDSRSFVFQ